MITVILVLVGVAAAAYGVVELFPGVVPWLYRALTAKDVLFKLSIGFFALVAIWSGIFHYMLLGALIFGVAFVLFFDQYSFRDIRRLLNL